MAADLTFKPIKGVFVDRYSSVTVWQVTGGPSNVAAFIYQCRLNTDIDGAPTSYGYDNPAAKNSLGGENLQKNLHPLEAWHWDRPKTSHAKSQKVGLGNACGDPGDGSKGWKNFLAGGHNFFWAGLYAVTREVAKANSLIIDDRPELEASRGGRKEAVMPSGKGYFPVVQPAGAPAPGYYVSKSAAVTDASLPKWDAKRYVDASQVPYAVWSKEWQKWKINGKSLQLGDYGVAIRPGTGATSGFVFGDAGGGHKVGEISKKLHDTLADKPGSSPAVTFIVFPGSGHGHEVGRNPEKVIPAQAMLQTLKLALAGNAKELPVRMAAGSDMVVPNKMTPEQSRQQANTARALHSWGL